MHLIIIHKKSDCQPGRRSDLLRLATSSNFIAGITFDALSQTDTVEDSGGKIIAVPQDWHINTSGRRCRIFPYDGTLPRPQNTKKGEPDNWFIISNGRYVTNIASRHFGKILAGIGADLIALTVEAELLSYQERVKLTSQGSIAGIRRLYSNTVLPTHLPTDWPHHIFIKPKILQKIIAGNKLPLTFQAFLRLSTAAALRWVSLKTGGDVIDLQTEQGLLRLIAANIHALDCNCSLDNERNYFWNNQHRTRQNKISPSARTWGKVIIGRNVHIAANALVIGPAILGDNVKVAPEAVIRASVIGPGISIKKGRLVQSSILTDGKPFQNLLSHCQIDWKKPKSPNSTLLLDGNKQNYFRTWPRFSYAQCGKRLADIIASLLALTIFAPVLPVIAVAIKLNSAGPVFFVDKRQGRHGVDFYCLKFRTMFSGAEKIQERLKCKSQVDGPQFKVKNDPRVTAIGRFLRDTFIDEIPQFVNILRGQMSIVGPRPSPGKENSLCPYWRNARLSVRPGITGLWQICRTRQQRRDFQEWIYYDTEYVKKLSPYLDLYICWKTAGKLISNFIEQF
ncbi:MAG: sugar transferase [Planctomycetota bacterium]|jgi:lipopolysaccharide/colanic/teichoic acid biosynthesis glycosyltransferase